jgi:hypothetical protein
VRRIGLPAGFNNRLDGSLVSAEREPRGGERSDGCQDGRPARHPPIPILSTPVTLLAFGAFLLGGAILGLTFEFLGPVWLMPLGFLLAVSGGATTLMGVIPWLWRVMA